MRAKARLTWANETRGGDGTAGMERVMRSEDGAGRGIGVDGDRVGDARRMVTLADHPSFLL